MTDYQEEQSNEIEALESIYPEELNILETEPFYSFEIPVNIEYENEDGDDTASATLQFTYTATYPDEAPAMLISESDGLEDAMLEQLKETMKQEAEETIGMGMVFTIVSAVQERMQELVEGEAKRKLDDKEEKIRLAEEAERNRFEGIRVTIETFLVWKGKFDAEIAEIKSLKGLKETNDNKPTGKELFLTDTSLDDSDMKFLEDEDESVTVDESLFQDIEDLDLDVDLECT